MRLRRHPYPVTGCELHVTVRGVVVILRQLLCLEKTLANLDQNLVTGAKESIGRLCLGRPKTVRQQRWGWPVVDHLEGRGAEGYMKGDIITILRPQQLVHPRTRTITCNTTQIHSNDFVNNFGLAVRLGMEGDAKTQGDTRHLKEVAPHMASEHRILVFDDRRRKTVVGYHKPGYPN